MINNEITYKKTIENTSRKRYDFIDVAKGIGVLFVIIAHVNYTPSILTTIYSFHMPLFFIISGMLFSQSNYSNFSAFIKRKVQTLICPYVLFYMLSILFHLIVRVIANIQNIKINEFLMYFSQMFLSQGSGKLPNAPLWFVPCLFVVEIIYFFISKLKKPLIITISLFMTFLGWFLESNLFHFKNELLPWSLDSALFAIGFFAIGNLIFDYICIIIETIRRSGRKNIIYMIIFLLAISILIPLALYNGKVSIGSKILNNGFIFYVTGMLGLSAILSLSVWLEKSKFLKYCGRNSFQIMAIHCLARDSLSLVYSFFDIPIYDKTNLIETILPIIIVICLSVLFVVFYNKVKSIVKGFNHKLN